MPVRGEAAHWSCITFVKWTCAEIFDQRLSVADKGIGGTLRELAKIPGWMLSMIVTTEHPGTPADPAARERILLVEDHPSCTVSLFIWPCLRTF